MSSQEAIHANHSAPLDYVKEKTTNDICGHSSETPLANYDPITRSWKMYGVISLWDLTESLETLPTSGMTQNGNLFQRPASARPIDVSGLSVWPTPTARDGKGASGHKKESRRLADLTYRARLRDGVTTGSLNPKFVEWLMGFPKGWTDLED